MIIHQSRRLFKQQKAEAKPIVKQESAGGRFGFFRF